MLTLLRFPMKHVFQIGYILNIALFSHATQLTCRRPQSYTFMRSNVRFISQVVLYLTIIDSARCRPCVLQSMAYVMGNSSTVAKHPGQYLTRAVASCQAILYPIPYVILAVRPHKASAGDMCLAIRNGYSGLVPSL